MVGLFFRFAWVQGTSFFFDCISFEERERLFLFPRASFSLSSLTYIVLTCLLFEFAFQAFDASFPADDGPPFPLRTSLIGFLP